jgi:hypothetical protein
MPRAILSRPDVNEKKGRKMSSLYCKIHGREKEREAVSDNDSMCEEGESVLIVHGHLISGPWRCDRCNAELTEGTEAYFEAIYPCHMSERFWEYDFSYECEYFALSNGCRLAVYGSPWPGGSPEEMLEDFFERKLLEEDYISEVEDEEFRDDDEALSRPVEVKVLLDCLQFAPKGPDDELRFGWAARVPLLQKCLVHEDSAVGLLKDVKACITEHFTDSGLAYEVVLCQDAREMAYIIVQGNDAFKSVFPDGRTYLMKGWDRFNSRACR